IKVRMATDEVSDASTSKDASRAGVRRRIVVATAALLVVYVVAAYLLIPLVWEQFARRHPAFDDDPRITQTSDGHPGDPLNVALIGTEDELNAIMHAAGWL